MEASNVLNRDRMTRWADIKNYSNEDMVMMEIATISNSSLKLEDYLCVEISMENDLTTLYHCISSSIPLGWFALSKEEYDENYSNYDAIEELSSLTRRARHKIWIDVPRTLDVFSRKAGRNEEILNDPSRKSRILAILCRVLCASSKLLGWYCQGMSFVAASYILYFYSAFDWTFADTAGEDIVDLLIGTYVVGVYHTCVLKECGFELLYSHGPALELFMAEFGNQLALTEQTAEVYSHLEDLHFTVHFYAVEWFTTCFVSSLSTEVCLLIQDMLIYGNQSKRNVLIKVGVAIMAALREKLLAFESMEQIQTHLKGMTMQLSSADIIPFALTYETKPTTTRQLLPDGRPDLAAMYNRATGTGSSPASGGSTNLGGSSNSSGGFFATLLDKKKNFFSSPEPSPVTTPARSRETSSSSASPAPVPITASVENSSNSSGKVSQYSRCVVPSAEVDILLELRDVS